MTKTHRKKVVIVADGPSGVGAALKLARYGHKDVIFLDRFGHVGGIPGKYPDLGKPTFIL